MPVRELLHHFSMCRMMILAFVFMLPLLQSIVADSSILPLSGLRFPMEHYPDGTIRTMIHAMKAEAPVGKPVTAEGVTVKMMLPDGTVETRITMQDCVIDRDRQTANSRGDVLLERKDAVITGTGMRWSGKDETVFIKSNVRVVLNRSADAKNRFSLF